MSWLYVILILLIVVFLLDGIRRARKNSRSKVKLSRNARLADQALAREDELMEQMQQQFPSGRPRRPDDDFDSKRAQSEAVPMLMESVEDDGGEEADLDNDPIIKADSGDDTEYEDEASNLDDGDVDGDHEEPSLGNIDDLDSEPEAPPEPLQQSFEAFMRPRKKESSEQDKTLPPVDDILVINVMAKSDQQFSGRALREEFLRLGLKYGARQIFHRHEDDDGDAPIAFSVANMVEPGYFRLADMNSCTTPGITLFLTLPCDVDSIAAYDDMTATAKALTETLNAELKDENRSILTRQAIEHSRQRIAEYERRRKLIK